MAARKAVTRELKTLYNKWLSKVESSLLPVDNTYEVAAVQIHIECLTVQEKLLELGEEIKICYPDMSLSIMHADDLPNDVYACIYKEGDSSWEFTSVIQSGINTN